MKCECGCGATPKPGKRFVHGHHARIFWGNPDWRAKATIALTASNKARTQPDRVRWSRDRAFVYAPNHPGASTSGCVPRSRAVMEGLLGRYLRDTEVVHHVNFDKGDDHPDNLYVFPKQSPHLAFHERLRRLGIEDHFRAWFSRAEREAT